MNREILEDNQPNSLHKMLRPILVLAQIFGLIPVQGISAPNSSAVRFTWFSKRVFYSCMLTVGIIIQTYLQLQKAKFLLYNLKTIVFCSRLLLSQILCLRLAKKWPNFIHHWEKLDRNLNALGLLPNIIYSMHIITFIFILSAFGHIIAFNITFFLDECIDFTPITAPTIFDHFNSGYFIVLFIIMNIITETIIELLLVELSFAVSSRFTRLNAELASVVGKNMSCSYWLQMREAYNIVSCITRFLNQHIAELVVHTMVYNLSTISYIYYKSTFFYGNSNERKAWLAMMAFTSIRTVAVIWCSGHILTESKKPLSTLFSVPTIGYNVEVERFTIQVIADRIVLNGFNFFELDKRIVVTLITMGISITLGLVQLKDAGLKKDTVGDNFVTSLCENAAAHE